MMCVLLRTLEVRYFMKLTSLQEVCCQEFTGSHTIAHTFSWRSVVIRHDDLMEPPDSEAAYHFLRHNSRRRQSRSAFGTFQRHLAGLCWKEDGPFQSSRTRMFLLGEWVHMAVKAEKGTQ